LECLANDGVSAGPASRAGDEAPALGRADRVEAPHPIDCGLAESEEARCACYRTLFADQIPQAELTAIRDATNGGFALGSERFKRPIAAMIGRRAWPGKSGRPKNQSPDADQLNLPI